MYIITSYIYLISEQINDHTGNLNFLIDINNLESFILICQNKYN